MTQSRCPWDQLPMSGRLPLPEALCLVPLEFILWRMVGGTVGTYALQLWCPTPRVRAVGGWKTWSSQRETFLRGLCQNPVLCGLHNGFYSEPRTGQASWYGWETSHQLLGAPALWSLPPFLASPLLVPFCEAAKHPDWDFMLCCSAAPALPWQRPPFKALHVSKAQTVNKGEQVTEAKSQQLSENCCHQSISTKAQQFIRLSPDKSLIPPTYVMHSDLIGHDPVQFDILGILQVRGEIWFEVCHVCFPYVMFKFITFIGCAHCLLISTQKSDKSDNPGSSCHQPKASRQEPSTPCSGVWEAFTEQPTVWVGLRLTGKEPCLPFICGAFFAILVPGCG